jgi:hypothetical protein
MKNLKLKFETKCLFIFETKQLFKFENMWLLKYFVDVPIIVIYK